MIHDPVPAPASMQLAIESSGTVASLCIGSREGIIAHRSLPNTPRTASTLAPALQSLLEEHSLHPGHFAQLAVTVGPGSFTGLRVGIATIKTLSYAWSLPIAPIDTLEALARAAFHWCEQQYPSNDDSTFWAALNAYRGEVFASRWIRTKNQWHRDLPSSAMGKERWHSLLAQDEPEHRHIFVAASPFLMPEVSLPPRLVHLPEAFWLPRVESVFELGWKAADADHLVSWLQIQPNYLRASAAEEKASSHPSD